MSKNKIDLVAIFILTMCTISGCGCLGNEDKIPARMVLSGTPELISQISGCCRDHFPMSEAKKFVVRVDRKNNSVEFTYTLGETSVTETWEIFDKTVFVENDGCTDEL